MPGFRSWVCHFPGGGELRQLPSCFVPQGLRVSAEIIPVKNLEQSLFTSTQSAINRIPRWMAYQQVISTVLEARSARPGHQQMWRPERGCFLACRWPGGGREHSGAAFRGALILLMRASPSGPITSQRPPSSHHYTAGWVSTYGFGGA